MACSICGTDNPCTVFDHWSGVARFRCWGRWGWLPVDPNPMPHLRLFRWSRRHG